MRYVKNISVKCQPRGASSEAITYTVSQFLREHVFVRPEWRLAKSNELLQTLLELDEKFPETLPESEIVELQDRQHEQLVSHVVLVGTGVERLPPYLVAPFTRLTLAVTAATSKAPEEAG